MNYGSWTLDDLLTFTVRTHTPSTGADVDADAVPTYAVYEDETGTAILTGSMAKLNDAGTTGFYSEQITLSAANGFELGKSYHIDISATVASVVGSTTYNFQMEAAVDATSISAAQSSAADIAAAVASELGFIRTTIATLTDQLNFTLTAGSADNDVYNGALMLITDSATSAQRSAVIVKDYVGGTKAVVLTKAPGFTIAVGDTVLILPSAQGLVHPEAYAALAAEATPVELAYMTLALNSERNKTGTTLTSRKLNGTDPAMTHTLDDATTVTDQTRAT